MSGSRFTINPSGDNTTRELVYCHQCHNEFYNDGPTGLICPECQSEFTEVIDLGFDPRTEIEQHDSDFGSHNPWAEVDDPEEDDIQHYVNRSLYPSIFDRPSLPQLHQQYPSRSPGVNTGGPDQDFASIAPLFGQFTSMLQSLASARPGPFQPTGLNFDSQNSQQQQQSERSRSAPGSPPPPGSQSQPQVSVWRRSGPGYSFTATTTRGGFQNFGGTRQRGIDGAQLDSLLQSLFQDTGREYNGTFMGQPPMTPGENRAGGDIRANGLAGLFNALLNPANAMHGDAVWSQQAFDRVISQLMEEHSSGNAPGPASEAAINALPREKVTKSMLEGEKKLTECSVCMDDPTLGDDIATLPCNHWFHFQCVEAWLKEHDTCPVCRRGIMPKEGDRNTARSPTEEPLHDEDPFLLARQQSGTRDHPFVVPESPTMNRRRPNPRRHSSTDPQSSPRRPSDLAGNERDSGGGGGIGGRMRSFFGGSGSNNNSNNNSSSSRR